MVYLDHAATTPVPRAVADVMYAVLTEQFGNPSAQYPMGLEMNRRVEAWRATVAQAVGCEPGRLFFTSCGTEGDNWAIHAAMEFNKRRGRHIVVSAIEHSAVLEPVRALAAQGCEVTYLKPDKSGRIRCEDLQAALRPDTALVSLMLVNNELGTLQPVRQAAEAIRRSGCPALLHTDAVQAFLKVPFTPAELGADLLTVSGHKIRAPKGIGVQYVRRGLEPSPLLMGGGQEQGRRSGREPTAEFAALAAACRAWDDSFPAHLSALKQYALETLAAVPGLEVVSAGDAPHICAVSLPGYPSEMLVRDLSDQGVSVSSGSACHKGKPSHVFAALGLPKRTLMGVLRISFSPENTRADVDALRDGLIQITKTRIAMR